MKKGVITIWVLAFSSVFLIILTGLLGFLIFQTKANQKFEARNLAFHVAEAGINFAKWRLAHSPNDFSFSGTYDYKDLEDNTIGKYQLEVFGSSGCSPSIKIKSTGWKLGAENDKRKIQITFAKQALAKYGFLTNSNAWFGANEELKGPFHSNGGIRMDGNQNSLSTSAKETYTCGPEHGCSTPQQKPGIWGAGDGGTRGLWQFPVSNIDFDGIVRDLTDLQEEAEASGVYLSTPTRHGFHLIFKDDGTVDIYSIKNLGEKTWSHDGQDWVYQADSIEEEEFYANYSLDSDCFLIFIEDDVWVEGIVKGRATVVAAKLPENPSALSNIFIANNITYADADSVLGLIAQNSVLIPLCAPDNLQISAAMLAQKGHVFRNYFPAWQDEPYHSCALRNKITTLGSIITNTIWTFSWVDSENNITSGYNQTEMNYDSNLNFNPPPYFPTVGDFELSSWEEID